MIDGTKIAAVVLAYRVENQIATTLLKIPEYIDRVYVVDDGSPDDTAGQINLCLTDKITLIQHPENQGPGAALRTGYRAALEADAGIIVKIDGDDQMDSERIIDLINPILAGSADYTKGDRLSLSGHYHNMPAVRLFGNRLLTWLTRVASGYWQLNDAQNGFTAISRPALEKVDAQLCAYYGYLNILLVKLSVSGARVFDVPMPSIYGSEKSAIRLWRYIPVVSLVIFRGLLWRMKVKLLRSDGRR